MKTIISSLPHNGAKPYTHLEPIVELLLASGNELSDPLPSFPLQDKGFYMDRDGWKCDFKMPIDFKLVTSNFEIPPSIIISEKNNSIFCQKTWVEIRGNIT